MKMLWTRGKRQLARGENREARGNRQLWAMGKRQWAIGDPKFFQNVCIGIFKFVHRSGYLSQQENENVFECEISAGSV